MTAGGSKNPGAGASGDPSGIDFGDMVTPHPDATDRLVGGARPALRRMAPGEVFANRYEIEALIGEGGAGTVYRAKDRLTARVIALKLIRTDRLASPGARERLIAEAVTARDIRHGNVVAVYDIGEQDGQPYMSMEHLAGQSMRVWMRARLAADADCSFATAARIIQNVLGGLEAAHGQDVVHRDLKPENIFLLAEPDDDAAPLKILDFGIARAAGTRTESAAATGTPHYMAPEQITAPETVRPSADLYSLSVLFYELLVGVLPQGHWQAPGEGRQDVPEEIDALIRRGLSNDRRRRPQTAAEYRAAVDAALKATAFEAAEEEADEAETTEAAGESEEATPERMGKDAMNRALALFGAADAEATDAEKAEARRLFGEAARWGVPLAMSNYAWFLERGMGGPEDKVAARDWYRASAEAGLVMGMTNYAGLLVNGIGGPKDLVVARQWYEKAAAKDDADAKAWLVKNPPTPAAPPPAPPPPPPAPEAAAPAPRPADGRPQALSPPEGSASTDAKRIAEGNALVAKAKAALNDAVNTFNNGDQAGGRRKFDAAHLQFQAAVRVNTAAVKVAYADFLEYGALTNFLRDTDASEIAKRWVASAARDGHPEAMAAHGLHLARRGPGSDFAAAQEWCRKAIAAGEMRGHRNLGHIHKRMGDLAGARENLRRGAEGGDAGSMEMLASMMLAGEGGPADKDGARDLALRGARAGDFSCRELLRKQFPLAYRAASLTWSKS